MKRLKNVLQWTGIALGVLVPVLLIANAGFVWITGARLERQLAAIREAGDPLSLAELAREPIPPENNAATFLRRADAGVDGIDKEFSCVQEEYLLTACLVSADEQKRIQSALDSYPEVIPLLDRAAACPDCDWQLDYTLSCQEFIEDELLWPVNKNRAAARVLFRRALLLASQGNRDAALRTALAIFRLARHFDRGPMVVSCLVAMAVRGIAIDAANLALQTGPVSKEVRDALDAELAVQERMDAYGWAIKSTRAFELDYLRTLPAGNFWLVKRGLWDCQVSEYLDGMQALLALAEDPSPYCQAEQTIRQTCGEIPPTPNEEAYEQAPFVQKCLGATWIMHNAVTRTRAQLRSLRVLNALQPRAPAASSEIRRLSELGLPAETTKDPYNGEPLHVKRLPQGWLVYSVGKNFQDDGGKLDDLSDVGVGPPPAAKPAEK
jgi:hypothetical protein